MSTDLTQAVADARQAETQAAQLAQILAVVQAAQATAPAPTACSCSSHAPAPRRWGDEQVVDQGGLHHEVREAAQDTVDLGHEEVRRLQHPLVTGKRPERCPRLELVEGVVRRGGGTQGIE